jgi:hypothetical protein
MLRFSIEADVSNQTKPDVMVGMSRRQVKVLQDILQAVIHIDLSDDDRDELADLRAGVLTLQSRLLKFGPMTTK